MIASRVSALKYRSSEYKMNRWFRCIFWIILTYVLAYFWMFWPLFHAPHSSSWPEPGNQNAANIVLPSTTSFDALRRRVRRILFWKVDHHDFSWYFLLSTFEIGGHFKSNAVSHFTTLSTLPWTWWAHLRSPIDLMLSRSRYWMQQPMKQTRTSGGQSCQSCDTTDFGMADLQNSRWV